MSSNVSAMPSSSGGVEVRRAELEDYQGVVDINRNLYEGVDYVAGYYTQLVTDPDLCFYVCTADGEVGAFEGVALVDGGDTIQTRAARVKDKFQGRGLLGYIRKKIYKDFKDVPGKKRIRTCCANNVRLVHSERFRNQNKLLLTRNLLSLDPVTTLTLPDEYAGEIPGVSHLDIGQFPELLQNKPLTDFLFPEEFFTSMSWFFEPRVGNVKYLEKLNPYLSVTSDLVDRLTGGGEMEGETLEGVLCISSYYLTPTSLFYVLDLHGKVKPEREEEEIRRVICHGLKRLVSLFHDLQPPKESIILGVSFQQQLNTAHAEKLFTALGLTRGRFAEAYNRHYFFEQDFEKLVS